MEYINLEDENSTEDETLKHMKELELELKNITVEIDKINKNIKETFNEYNTSTSNLAFFENKLNEKNGKLVLALGRYNRFNLKSRIKLYLARRAQYKAEMEVVELMKIKDEKLEKYSRALKEYDDITIKVNEIDKELLELRNLYGVDVI